MKVARPVLRGAVGKVPDICQMFGNSLAAYPTRHGIMNYEAGLVVGERQSDQRNRHSMPTVFQDGPYAFRFYSADHVEPLHVHRDRNSAKFWLNPVRLARNWGFPAHELRDIRRIVEARQAELLEAWNDYFGA